MESVRRHHSSTTTTAYHAACSSFAALGCYATRSYSAARSPPTSFGPGSHMMPLLSPCYQQPPAAPCGPRLPRNLNASHSACSPHQPGTAPKTSSTLPRPPRPISPSPACPATPSVMPLIPELCVEIPPYVVIMQGSCHSVVNLIAPHRCKTLPYVDVCHIKHSQSLS